MAEKKENQEVVVHNRGNNSGKVIYGLPAGTIVIHQPKPKKP